MTEAIKSNATRSHAHEPRAWQRMLSGKRLDLLQPDPADILIEDIAHGLARVARWNGQTHGAHAFSVAQHSLVVVDIVDALEPDWPNRWRLAALLHDAPEFVVGDLISPFKAAVGDAYKSVERRLLAAIHAAFALPDALPGEVARTIKVADGIAAYHEATCLAGFSVDEARTYFETPPPLPDPLCRNLTSLSGWPTERAQAAFREAFEAMRIDAER
jgi:5'-deoxynucleotidase YfbR-like HD superfamily hydrolase